MSLKEYHNAHDYVKFLIAEKLGLNIRIQSSTKEKNTITFTLMGVIPFEIKLVNGYKFTGSIKINDLDTLIFTEHSSGLKIIKKEDPKLIDKKISDEIYKFNSGIKISTIQWSGRKIMEWDN